MFSISFSVYKPSSLSASSLSSSLAVAYRLGTNTEAKFARIFSRMINVESVCDQARSFVSQRQTTDYRRMFAEVI